MILPLLRYWLKAVTGSILLFRSHKDKTPTGFRTIGGGDGNHQHGVKCHRNPLPSVNPLPSGLTITIDGGQNMEDEMEMQDRAALKDDICKGHFLKVPSPSPDEEKCQVEAQ